MKTSILFILFYFTIGNANAQCDNFYFDCLHTNSNDLKENKLKGKVKKVIQKCYNANVVYGDLSKGDLMSFTEVLFNQYGFAEYVNYIDVDDTLKFIKEKCDYNNGFREFISRYNYNGNLIQKYRYQLVDNSIIKMTYDSIGQPYVMYSVYSFNDDGLLISEEVKCNSNIKKNRVITTSPAGGEDIINNDIKDYCLPSKILHKQSTYKYEDSIVYNIYENNDDLVKIVYYPKLYEAHEYKFDNTTKKISLKKRTLIDINDNITKEFENNLLTQKNEYIYDNHSNWVYKLSYETEAQIPTYIIERIVTYYD